MALSNLVVEKLEQYGGIDLKRNAHKSFSSALSISIGLHLVVALSFMCWSWLSDRDVPQGPKYRPTGMEFVILDPSETRSNGPHHNAVHPPHLPGVTPEIPLPIPVPISVVTTPVSASVPSKVVESIQASHPMSSTVAQTIQPSKGADPDPAIFVYVSQEPEEVTPIEQLMKYPELARHAGLEGKVSLQALVSEDGHIEKILLISADNDLFKQAAIDAMMAARFSPARLDGKPMRVWITRTIDFKLVK